MIMWIMCSVSSLKPRAVVFLLLFLFFFMLSYRFCTARSLANLSCAFLLFNLKHHFYDVGCVKNSALGCERKLQFFN